MQPVELYLQVRQREGRLYPDAVLARLPDISSDSPLAGEWRQRRESSSRLLRYLGGLPAGLDILDLGCGNGWLSDKLSRLPSSQVWALDNNRTELSQARRVFKSRNLFFILANIDGLPLKRTSFDIILLASVIQYFSDLPCLVRNLLPLLKHTGEIHILDSPLYAPGEIDAARQRTQIYYETLGFPQMAEHYFHHPITALDGFSPRWHYRPQSLRASLARFTGSPGSPFPWVSLRFTDQF